jgi:hypothetical protein
MDMDNGADTDNGTDTDLKGTDVDPKAVDMDHSVHEGNQVAQVDKPRALRVHPPQISSQQGCFRMPHAAKQGGGLLPRKNPMPPLQPLPSLPPSSPPGVRAVHL